MREKDYARAQYQQDGFSYVFGTFHPNDTYIRRVARTTAYLDALNNQIWRLDLPRMR